MASNIRAIIDQIQNLAASGEPLHADDVNELAQTIELLRQRVAPEELPSDLVIEEATPNRSG